MVPELASADTCRRSSCTSRLPSSRRSPWTPRTPSEPDIADSAAAIQKQADAALQAGYSDYQNALASVQIFDSPLTSLTGPTGA